MKEKACTWESEWRGNRNGVRAGGQAVSCREREGACAKSHFLQIPMGQKSGQSLFPDSDLLDLGRAMATWSRKSARL